MSASDSDFYAPLSFIGELIAASTDAEQAARLRTSCVEPESKFFYALELNQPLSKSFAREAIDSPTYQPGDFTAALMYPRVVLQTAGYNMPNDFKYDDLYRCLRLRDLINLRAAEPLGDDSITERERDIMFTNAYTWILKRLDKNWTDYEVANDFRKFVLEYTGFESVDEMRSFVDIVYINEMFLTRLQRDEDSGFLMNDGLGYDSPVVVEFVQSLRYRCCQRMARALRDDDYVEYERLESKFYRLCSEFIYGDTERYYVEPLSW
jgi:hypothetical protein